MEAKPELAIVLMLAASLTGCGGGGTSNTTGTTTTGGSTGGGTTPLTAGSSFYVVQDDFPQPPTILQFARTANGSGTPASTIKGPADVGFTGLTVDGSGNLYVGGQVFSSASSSSQTGAEILVYAAGTSGTPSQTITAGLNADSTNSIPAMTVDSSQNLYAVTDVAVGSGASGHIYQGIAVFSTTNGTVASLKSIAGTATGISNPTQLAIDSSGNIYLANASSQGAGSVLIFNSSATGNMAPTNSLGGAKTTIYFAEGVALDGSGNIYVSSVAENPQSPASGGGTPSILKFSAASTGNVAPVLAISGSATTMSNIGNLRVDSAGSIYILNGSNILRFAPGATGNVAPAATISSSAFFGTNGPIALQ